MWVQNLWKTLFSVINTYKGMLFATVLCSDRSVGKSVRHPWATGSNPSTWGSSSSPSRRSSFPAGQSALDRCPNLLLLSIGGAGELQLLVAIICNLKPFRVASLVVSGEGFWLSIFLERFLSLPSCIMDYIDVWCVVVSKKSLGWSGFSDFLLVARATKMVRFQY